MKGNIIIKLKLWRRIHVLSTATFWPNLRYVYRGTDYDIVHFNVVG